MSLKKDIVIVNEFTSRSYKNAPRGKSPGAYVLRYMNRQSAVEKLAPVRKFESQNFIERYMLRESATEKAFENDLDKDKLRENMEDDDMFSAISFGKKGRYHKSNISLSKRSVKEISDDIQDNFDKGKTVFKTVISFSEDYLRQNGVIDENFTCEKKGDYRGNIDQLKLRSAIMNGVDKMSKDFDDLEYIGVLQVDTKHVHCHLCMVDRGEGRLMPDGSQRGKLLKKDKITLRRGINDSLDELSIMKKLSKNTDYDKRNIKGFVKKFSHEMIKQNTLSQFLLATLPENKNLWRASSNRREMQKPNSVVRFYVNELFKNEDSGYDEAVKNIKTYALTRFEKEGLSTKDYRKLIDKGLEKLEIDSMNSVYQVLKGVKSSDKSVMTPTLDMFSMDYESLLEKREAESSPMIEFGFKLRSYGSRLNHHKKEFKKYKKLTEDFEDAQKKNKVSQSALALVDFYRTEREYNEKVMSKYQHFLAFLPKREDYSQDFNEVLRLQKRSENMNTLLEDKTFNKFKSRESAELYGFNVYGIKGCGDMYDKPNLMRIKRDNMNKTYEDKRERFVDKLSESGLSLNDDNKLNLSPKYDFDDVKALDLHHLFYDFNYDVAVSQVNINNFVDMADRRVNSYIKAKEYLINTNQDDLIKFEDEDIKTMKQTADIMRTDKVLVNKKADETMKYKRSKTVRLDNNISKLIENNVKREIESTKINFEGLDI